MRCRGWLGVRALFLALFHFTQKPTMLTRPLILTLVALGVARCYEFTLLDWISNVLAVLYTAVAAMLTAAWTLLHPAADSPRQYVPDLHQAILNVTRDATRVADLLEEFFAQQYRDDPALKDKFMAYMSAQANTSYSVVDNQLSWILWLYGILWMPLLAVLCIARASRCARHGRSGERTVTRDELQSTSPPQHGSKHLLEAGRREPPEKSMDHVSRAASAGRTGSSQPQQASAGAANLRALRRSATTAAPSMYRSEQAHQLHASSDMHMLQQQQQQQKLTSSASVPARGLTSNSSYKTGSSARWHGAFDPDVCIFDQYHGEVASAGAGMRSARSVVVRHHQGAATVAGPVHHLQMVT